MAPLGASKPPAGAPAHTPAEVVVDPQLEANDGFVEIPTGADDETTLRSVNGPVTFASGTRAPTRPVPRLGEHTDEILAELSPDGA